MSPENGINELPHIVFDLEATCWGRNRDMDRMEIIEIGAARLDPESYDITGTFTTFVKPVVETELSDFCTGLTSIRQQDVDPAPEFPEAIEIFFDWIGGGDVTFCSWGAYDIKQLRADYRRHGISMPEAFRRHINLKRLFADLFERRACGMKNALKILGLELKGTHHRGVDDAVNISKIAKVILPMHYKNKPAD